MFRSNVRHITTFKFTYYEKEKTNIKRNVGNDKRFSNKTNANSKTTFRLDAIRYDTTYTGWLYGNLDKEVEQ